MNKKLLVITFFTVFMLNVYSVLALETNLIKECINNSKSLKSYHSEMYMIDLADERIKGKDIHIIDWYIDYISPDKISVEQYARVDKLADKWITMGDTTFRYFNFWVEMPSKDEKKADTLGFNKSLLQDKYVEILEDNTPVLVSEEGDLEVLSYSPKNWKNYNNTKIWDLRHGYKCVLTVWISKKDRLIKKAAFIIDGIAKNGKKVNYQMNQTFSNYNGDITIDKPKALNFEKDKSKIIDTIRKLKEEGLKPEQQ